MTIRNPDEVKRYFIEDILVKYSEYKDLKNNLQLGLNKDKRIALELSSILYHFRELIDSTEKITYNYILDKCPEYALIRDIANASKHFEIDRNNPKIIREQDIQEMVVTTIYSDDIGEYSYIQKKVFATTIEGEEIDTHLIIVSVLNFWKDFLIEHGIIESRKDFIAYSDVLPNRDEFSNNLNLVIDSDLDLKKMIKLQRYNYEKKKVEIVDTTGMSATMRIRKKEK